MAGVCQLRDVDVSPFQDCLAGQNMLREGSVVPGMRVCIQRFIQPLLFWNVNFNAFEILVETLKEKYKVLAIFYYHFSTWTRRCLKIIIISLLFFIYFNLLFWLILLLLLLLIFLLLEWSICYSVPVASTVHDHHALAVSSCFRHHLLQSSRLFWSKWT